MVKIDNFLLYNTNVYIFQKSDKIKLLKLFKKLLLFLFKEGERFELRRIPC